MCQESRLILLQEHGFLKVERNTPCCLFEGSLEVKLPTIWTDRSKSRGGKSQRREKKKKEDQRRERVRRKKMEMREKVGKSRKTVFFHVFRMIWGSGGSKSRLAKAAGAGPSGGMRAEKLHTVVARSTFGSEKTENTSHPEHFWQL